ncbi:molybdenum cofactor sulfurase-like [Macrobrachium nipponense]|uniref:molybdenum cofactor sulfurase-like n=1 Tax=Macrobrachium nipponense TaxID=159736 RepID=UPI0030C80A93
MMARIPSELENYKIPANYDVQRVQEDFVRCKDQHYLDHAAATLYSESQIKSITAELQGNLFGNPHSRHTPSDTATQIIESVRQRIFEHFNTTCEEYDVIFTSGATDAIRLVAQNFDWNCTYDISRKGKKGREPGPPQHVPSDPHQPRGAFVYQRENHTSVLGIRDYANHLMLKFTLRIFEHFNTTCEEYDVIFTSGATDAIRLVAQNFDWNCTYDISRKGKKGREPGPPQHVPSDPHQPRGAFVYQRENHTSVLGIRDYANHFDAEVYSVRTKKLKEILGGPGAEASDTQANGFSNRDSADLQVSKEEDLRLKRHCLFAYSPQCNFSGAKTPLNWIEKVHNGLLNEILKEDPINRIPGWRKSRSDQGIGDPEWFVLLDAAGLVATCPLDLSRWKPDFVNLSFYKIMGYPTGLGCLLVSSRCWDLLRKTYYGGGTVQMVDSRKMTLVPRPVLHDRFEDGTLPYLSIIAVRHGFDVILKHTGGMENIMHHVFNLSRYTHHCLRSYRHTNGESVAEFYLQDESWTVDIHGSIINFNLLRSNGSYVGYAQVEKMASLYNIHLRTGCLCNPGACQTYLEISEDKLKRQFQAGHVCGDTHDLVDGQPTGSVRISFGYMSTYKDADQLLRMIAECFVDGPLRFDSSWMSRKFQSPTLKAASDGKSPRSQSSSSNSGQGKQKQKGTSSHGKNHNYSSTSNKNCKLILTDIIVYPVKSCCGVSVHKWKVASEGLQYDRKWMVVTDAGVTMTQKRLPQMCLIRTRIDLESNTLTLFYEGKGECSVPLKCPSVPDCVEDISICGGRVCGDKVKGLDCGKEVGDWLSKVLNKPSLKLMRQINTRRKKIEEGQVENLSLANESQYLILHLPSVRKLLEDINDNGPVDLNEVDLVKRFRGNFIIDGGDPYEEDIWKSVTIDGVKLQVQGGCMRCQMIGVASDSGERTREPMLTLGRVRGSSMMFGIYAKVLTPNSDDTDGSVTLITRGATVRATT